MYEGWVILIWCFVKWCGILLLNLILFFILVVDGGKDVGVYDIVYLKLFFSVRIFL